MEISAIDDGSRPPPGNCTSSATSSPTTDPAFQALLADFLSDREKRTMRMAAALTELGFVLDEREIRERNAAGKPIGRPHLAEAVLRSPENGERLREEAIDDIGSLIRGYLIEGKPAFRLRETPTVGAGR